MMPLSDPALWQKVSDWRLPTSEEVDDSHPEKRRCRRFEHDLSRADGWTDDSAARITAIYRRFLYIKALTGEVLTPSLAVDSAWHLHLAFGGNYSALCRTLGRDIPHHSALGRRQRDLAYTRARELLIAEFDETPDVDVWPLAEGVRMRRFGRVLVVAGFAVWCVGSIGIPWIGFHWWVLAAGFLLLVVGAGLQNVDPPRSVAPCG